MTGRYTLLIDGSYFLFRTLFVLPGTFKSNEILGSDEDIEIYIRKLATDLSYQIRLFEGLIDDVVWTIDSKSWRKEIHPESDYKGTRKYNDNMNWENFAKASKEFVKILSKHGISISAAEGAEADDLVYAWASKCLGNNKSAIILSGDKDLIQLVDRTANKDAHIIFYSPVHKKIYAKNGFCEWLDHKDEPAESDDFFDSLKIHTKQSNRIKDTFKNIKKKKKLEFIEIDPDAVRFKKVLTGDSGDNVPPAYWKTMTSKSGKTRTYGVSDNKANAIYDEFIKKHGSFTYKDFSNDDVLVDIANTLIKHLKVKDKNTQDIVRNIRTNISLMILSSTTIPENIISNMRESVEYLFYHKTQMKSLNNMKSLLEGTKYVDDITQPKGFSASVFKDDDSDDDSDMSFIKDRKKNERLF